MSQHQVSSLLIVTLLHGNCLEVKVVVTMSLQTEVYSKKITRVVGSPCSVLPNLPMGVN